MKGNSGPLSLMVECEQCGNKFPVNNTNGTATFRKEVVIDGKTIYLTYYDCPECSRRHFVQIDNQKSLSILETTIRQTAALMALKRNGKSISRKHSVEYKKTREQLASVRNELMKEYDGKLVCIDSELALKLRFSV